MYNCVFALDIAAYNNQSCTGIEPTLLSSAEELIQIVLSTRPRKHMFNRKNWDIYIDDLKILPQARKSWMSSTKSSIDCVSTVQARWKTKWLFNSTAGFLAGADWKKITLIWKDWEGKLITYLILFWF